MFTTKTLKRIVRRRFQAAVIWAMVPLAAVSGQSVSGCMSAKGQFDPNCRCWAASSTSDSTAVHQCHCKCCGTDHCCCKNKTNACAAMAKHTTTHCQPAGVRTGARCRPVTAYFTVTAVNGAHQTTLDHTAVSVVVATFDVPTNYADMSTRFVVQLNTGPPADNLTVALHRWVI